ncbi:hypothetical protein I3215_00035 [Streptomyces sp. RB110-1]|nr:hypothetical protein [Streptomyces sp. RB110-1]
MRSTPELAPPRVLRWPGSITEKISFSRTDLPAAVLQEEDAGGGGAAGRADRLVLEELRLGGGGSGTGAPTPRRSRTVSA